MGHGKIAFGARTSGKQSISSFRPATEEEDGVAKRGDVG